MRAGRSSMSRSRVPWIESHALRPNLTRAEFAGHAVAAEVSDADDGSAPAARVVSIVMRSSEEPAASMPLIVN